MNKVVKGATYCFIVITNSLIKAMMDILKIVLQRQLCIEILRKILILNCQKRLGETELIKIIKEYYLFHLLRRKNHSSNVLEEKS